MSNSIVGATAQTSLAAVQHATPASSGRRRPTLSDSGPMTSWPNPSPSRNAVSVSSIVDVLTANCPAIRGSAVRYMSVENGDTEVARASAAITKNDGRPPRGDRRSALS